MSASDFQHEAVTETRNGSLRVAWNGFNRRVQARLSWLCNWGQCVRPPAPNVAGADTGPVFPLCVGGCYAAGTGGSVGREDHVGDLASIAG